jgi:3-deoxy-D-manno-octulosonate 8-phosphate phosphatase (KDO 8-P phosphatase)
VRLAVFDVDGVLTDGRIYIGPRGETMKAFHVRDGYGLKALARAGVEVGLLTARESAILARRAQELGIPLVVQGAQDKAAVLAGWLGERGLEGAQAAYLGDDLPDLGALALAGLPAAVADAHARVRAAAAYVTALPGGQGAARELCDLILQARESHARKT